MFFCEEKKKIYFCELSSWGVGGGAARVWEGLWDRSYLSWKMSVNPKKGTEETDI